MFYHKDKMLYKWYYKLQIIIIDFFIFIIINIDDVKYTNVNIIYKYIFASQWNYDTLYLII